MRWKPISRRGRRTDGILALFVALGLSPFINAAVFGKELPRYGVFVFSNECVDNSKNGGGDVEGDRITLLRFPSGDMVIYEYGNGGAMGPILAQSVKLGEKDSSIKFKVRDEWGSGPTVDGQGIESIEGKLSAGNLVVTLHGGAEKVLLPRMQGLPKPPGDCK
jgi:hypothetical protein